MEAVGNRLRSLSKSSAAKQNDLSINNTKFAPSNIAPETSTFLNQLDAVGKKGPQWYEVGAETYRQMRWNGETSLPKPVVDPTGTDGFVPSRDAGRAIPIRVFTPSNGAPKGVYYHIHGGGWVLQSEKYQDSLLRLISDAAHLTVVSVGYRLAPEDPWPAGANDCFDVAEWLVDNARAKYDAPLLFVGGESAGGHLSAVVAFHLIRSRPQFYFRAIVFNFGCFDLSFTPSVINFKRNIVLWKDIMLEYRKALLPGKSLEELRDPAISPLWADLDSLAAASVHRQLPTAFFSCGTTDCLLDDTVFFSSAWARSGAETHVKIYPGGPHGLIMYPRDKLPIAGESQDDLAAFLKDQVSRL